MKSTEELDETKSCIKFVKLHPIQGFTMERKEYWRLIGEEVIETYYDDLRTPLIPFLPKNALDEVVRMLQKYPIHLQIQPRGDNEWLGQYQNLGDFNRIKIVNNMGKDEFLEVFLHEYAHLLQHKAFSLPSQHSLEFRFCFQELIFEFIKKNIISKHY